MFVAMMAATDQNSVCAMSASVMSTQKFATKNSIIVSDVGNMPSGGGSKVNVSTTIEAVRIAHGIRNAINAAPTFAIVYCIVEIGRLSTNNKDFSLRSFMIP